MSIVTPAHAGDVLATLGSGNKLHVVTKAHVHDGKYLTVAYCGRRGKARVQQAHVLPPNTSDDAYVCRDCREYMRKVS